MKATRGGGARFQLGHIAIDRLTLEQAVDGIVRLAEGPGGLVFTPSVNHVVRAERDLALREAYGTASLCLADGMPIVWTSRVMGQRLPERVAGSDLFAPLMERAARDRLRVYLLGGRAAEGDAPFAGEAAKSALEAHYPGILVVGVGPATRDVVADPRLLDAVEEEIRSVRAHLVVVALGSPLQEIWSARVRDHVAPAVLLGLGSVVDIWAGRVPRAPPWMRKAGLEWGFRLACEPRRLWRRYLVDDPRFVGIALRELRKAGRPAR